MHRDRWLSFARHWLDEGVVERSIEPLVADWQHELSTSTGRGRFAVVRGHLALARCVLSCLLRDMRRPLPQGVGAPAWLVAEAFATLGVIIIGMIFEWSTQRRLPFASMLPANLAIALPLATVTVDDHRDASLVGRGSHRTVAGPQDRRRHDRADAAGRGLDRPVQQSAVARERRRAADSAWPT